MPAPETILITPQDMRACFTAILIKAGFSNDKASQCATIFTDNSIDGIYTHGVNRFPRFVKYVMEGLVKPGATPEKTAGFGGMEQWNGNLGPGPLNATMATERAMQLASAHGIGCVALSHTNHWMRAGTYGWQAAKKGYILIAWTNTIANMPAWGAANAKLGNNPIVFAMPFGEEAVVLDMAMSQFSLGSMELAAMKGNRMSVNAGFDANNKLTDDPTAILATRRLIPTGYWKGAGMALLLDILSAVLANGLATHEIGKDKTETGLSQVFIAIDLSRLPHHSSIHAIVNNIIEDYRLSVPMEEGKRILYPGERVVVSRKENAEGIPVQKKVWDIVRGLEADVSDTSHIAAI
jgi:3-dehydro-L-gulonate 2-dehydrogenase